MLRKEPFGRDLTDFIPRASGFFSAPDVGLASKKRLHEGVLKLRQLELEAVSQHEGASLGLATLCRPFLTTSWAFPAGPRDPEEVELLGGPLAWCTQDRGQWDLFHSWASSGLVFRTAFPEVDLSTAETARAGFAESRTVTVPGLTGVTTDRWATLKAVVLMMGPAYFFEVTLSGEGGGGPATFMISHPGLDLWYRAMDRSELIPEADVARRTPGRQASDVKAAEQLAWGEVSIVFPADLLPRAPFKVRTTYRHLPGPSIQSISRLHRMALMRELTLKVTKDAPSDPVH
ncbi:MAG: hypothetical protein HY815_06920 [Candidatus Riflebacteria bacterium]|nr:hypothetical protein [Candidatus Riflebacteria bacterium]